MWYTPGVGINWGEIGSSFRSWASTHSTVAREEQGVKSWLQTGHLPIKAPVGYASRVSDKIPTSNGSNPDYLNLIILGVGAFLVIKLLD